jgi:hypothetical protein
MQSPDHTPEPPAYGSKFVEEAGKLALAGTTDEGLAEYLGIPLATLHEWLASKPEFADAVHYARNLADAAIVAAIERNATGGFPEVITRRGGAGKRPVTYIRRTPPSKAAREFLKANRLAGRGRSEVEVGPVPRDDPWELSHAELDRLFTDAHHAAGYPADG